MSDFPVEVYMRLDRVINKGPLDFVVMRLMPENCLDEVAVLAFALKPVRIFMVTDRGEQLVWNRYPVEPARLDADKTAKPKTRLIAKIGEDHCFHGNATHFEDEKGERTKLK